MSLTKQIAHNTSAQIIGKVISTVLGIVAVMIMTRALGVEQFGWYATAVGFLQFVGILSDFGFTVTTSSMLAEPRFDKQRLLDTLFTWRFLTAALFQGIAPLIIWFFPYPAPIKYAVAITTFSFFAISLNNVFIGYYQERLKTLVTATGEVLGRALLVIGIATCAILGWGFLPIMGAITLASIINTLYLYLKLPRLRFSFDKIISAAIFHKIWPTATTVIFNAVYLQGDRVILPLYASQIDVGLYAAAYRVLDIMIQMGALTMGIMLPLLTYSWSRQQKTDFNQRAQTSFNLVALILIPLVAGAIALAQPIMLFVAGAEFSASGDILSWLSLAVLGICFGSTFGHIILAADRQRQAIWIYASDAVLSLIGYFLFIPRWGLWGAVGVTIFSEFYAGLMLYLTARHYTQIKLEFGTLFKIIVASASMALIVSATTRWPVLISISAGAIVYVALVVILRVISENTIREVLTNYKTGTQVS